jgi:hypothetical protein
MAQHHQRQPFEMPFTFSLHNILSIVADHLSKKSTFGDLPPSIGDLTCFLNILYEGWLLSLSFKHAVV